MSACDRKRALVSLRMLGVLTVSFGLVAEAQPPAESGAAQSARESALFDMTGQWVAVVNEDWRWRMITPPTGDVASLPMNGRGRAEAQAWDLERDRADGQLCKAFGAPGLIRQPTRIRVRWDDEDTLVLDFDAGRQTRQLEFGEAGAPAGSTLQGHSRASWFRQRVQRGVFGSSALPGGALHVVTTNLAPGYLRPNGVPYSDRTTMKEYFHTFTLPEGGGTWLIVTSVVDDPVYLTQELVLSTQFRKEEGRSNWNPRDCDIAPPLVEREPAPPGPFG